MKQSLWTVFPFIPVLLFASILPDVDGLMSETVAGHHSILHTPIYWIVIFGLMVFVGRIIKNEKIKPISLGIFIGTQLHLFSDWFTARTVGIKWLYPFSDKDYFLYQIQPEQGQGSIWEMVQNPYFSFYMSNGFLFWIEIGIVVFSVFLLSKNRLSKFDI
tara:strand:+ start:801 stop:1280 length:480 start_codon:yes stop_codon:yes gene_type:complete